MYGLRVFFIGQPLTGKELKFRYSFPLSRKSILTERDSQGDND